MKLVKKLGPGREVLSFCYEAGPCGYGIHRQLTHLGHDCAVVAPSLIPRKAGDRVKTDRRDSESLARLHRAGELTAVLSPRTRARGGAGPHPRPRRYQGPGASGQTASQCLISRHGRLYAAGKTKWTKAHTQWLMTLTFEAPSQQIVFQEYVDIVAHLAGRVAALEEEMVRVLDTFSLAPVVRALMALRGVSLITALTVVAEIGDLTRFTSPRQLMAYLGLVPSESSSGATTRRGGITKTGNGHVRRVLTEAAWCYRFPARKTAHLQRRAGDTSDPVQAIAWKAQKRLCGRYQHLLRAGKIKVQVCTAIARELTGFLWAIACTV